MESENAEAASERRLGRRHFLAAGLASGVLPLAVPGSGAAREGSDPVLLMPVDDATHTLTPLPVRRFGKTGRELPVLSYGGAALPSAWLNPLSAEERVRLVRYAYDRGLRYFDTAGNYLESQRILGEALKDVRRDVFLVTKVETTDPQQVRGAVEKSLKELQTDHLDAILIHGTPGIENMTVERAMKIHDELVRLRDEKVVTFLGLSAHSYFDKALALIASGGFELCMLAYGYIPRGYNQVHSARMIALRDACLAKAHELGMGIAAMKVIGAGVLGAWASYVVPGYDQSRLKQLSGAAIRYVLDDDRIDTLVIGMRLKAEIDANVRTLTGDLKYTPADRALLAAYSAMAYESDAIKKLRIE
jgi:predicted aldo/keto reductase-like oxidoreductase